jgi:hypothetical protein
MVERDQAFGAIIDTNHGPGLAARGQQLIHQKKRHAPIAVRVWVDVTQKPVVVAGFYTFILLCGYKFILLR